MAEIAARTVVDDEGARATAAEVHRLCQERLQQGARPPGREATVQVQVPGRQRIGVPVRGGTTIAELTGLALAELGERRLLFAVSNANSSAVFSCLLDRKLCQKLCISSIFRFL